MLFIFNLVTVWKYFILYFCLCFHRICCICITHESVVCMGMCMCVFSRVRSQFYGKIVADSIVCFRCWILKSSHANDLNLTTDSCASSLKLVRLRPQNQVVIVPFYGLYCLVAKWNKNKIKIQN